MGYFIKWEYVGCEWRPIEILQPNGHTHYFSYKDIRYEVIGSTPLDYYNRNTKWLQITSN